jgi:type I restriction enzyme S subunit
VQCPEIIDGADIGSSKFRTVADDVLVCKINPRINRVWQTREGISEFPKIASPEWLILRFPEAVKAVIAPYVRFYLTSPRFREWITGAVSGATGSHTRAKAKDILNQLIPVPPMEEQRRIVVALDEQLSRIATGLSLLEGTERRLGLLQYNIGNLNTSPAGDARGEGRWVKFGDLVESSRGGWSRSRAHLVPADQGTPYLKMGNISPLGGLDLSQVVHVATDEESLAKYAIREGDVLFNNKNSQELVGKTALADYRVAGWVFNENISRIRLVGEVLPEYAVLQMNSSAFRKELAKMRSASTNVAAIYTRDLKRAPFWLPPVEEQRRLVDEYADFYGKADRLHPVIKASKARGQALRRSLLAEAFAGRLVPQNPADEPADALLARIRAEQESRGAVKSRRRNPRRAPAQRRRTPTTLEGFPPLEGGASPYITAATQPTLDLEIPS